MMEAETLLTNQTATEEKTVNGETGNDVEKSENNPKATKEERLETSENKSEEAQNATTNVEETLNSNDEIKLDENVDQTEDINTTSNIEIINDDGQDQTTQENGVLERVDIQIKCEENNEETPNKTTPDVGNPASNDVNILDTRAEKQHEENQAEIQGVDTPNIEAAPTPLQITLLHPNVKTTIEQYIDGFGITDYTLAVSLATDVGDNFSGLIGKIEINGLKNGTPVSRNWIVKTAPHLEMYRSFVNIEKFYAREVFTYSELFPLFKTLQATNNILEPFDNHPEYILSSLAPMEETVVMEDMKSLGYVLRDRQKTLDLDHVKLVMKTYGKFHALSFALKTLNRDSWQWVRSGAKNALMEGFKKDAVYKIQRPFMDKIVATLDQKTDAKYLQKFKKFSDNFIDVYLDCVQKSSDFEVMLHGDCWVNNMLWKYNDDKPEKVCLIDWQQSNCGSPASDLTYFLFTSTSKEFRDQYYESMLRLYYYSFCEHLNEFGVNPEVCLSFEELKNQMKTFGVIGLYYSLILLGIVTKDRDEIPEWRDDSVDISEFSAKFLTSGQKSEEDFRVRVRGVIVDYYEKGYLDCLQ